MREENGNLHYDSYHATEGSINYKGEDIEDIDYIEYEYKAKGKIEGGRKKLNRAKIIKTGISSGSGYSLREDEKVTFSIKWQDKSESFELACKNKH